MQQWARFAILGAMFVTAYLLILAWQKDYGGAQAETAQQAVAVQQSANTSTDIPSAQAQAASATDIPQANTAQADTPVASTANSQQLVTVATDMYNVWIDPKGGDIVRLELLSHDKSKDSDQPFVMLHNDKNIYVAQSGLIGADGPDSRSRPMYEVNKNSYSIDEAQSTVTKDDTAHKVLEVPMVYKTADGVEIFKIFKFT